MENYYLVQRLWLWACGVAALVVATVTVINCNCNCRQMLRGALRLFERCEISCHVLVAGEGS